MQQIVTKANVKLSNVLKYILSFIQDSKQILIGRAFLIWPTFIKKVFLLMCDF